MCKITLTAEKTTKNTVRFTEVLEGKLTNPVIGTLYVPKETLKAMSWNDGDDLTVDIAVAGKPKNKNRTTAAEKAAATKTVSKSTAKSTSKKSTGKKVSKAS